MEHVALWNLELRTEECSSLRGDAVEESVIAMEHSWEAVQRYCALVVISAGSWSMLMTGSLGASKQHFHVDMPRLESGIIPRQISPSKLAAIP